MRLNKALYKHTHYQNLKYNNVLKNGKALYATNTCPPRGKNCRNIISTICQKNQQFRRIFWTRKMTPKIDLSVSRLFYPFVSRLSLLCARPTSDDGADHRLSLRSISPRSPRHSTIARACRIASYSGIFALISHPRPLLFIRGIVTIRLHFRVSVLS